MIEPIDHGRLADVRQTCDFLVAHIRKDGRFHPPDALWAETSGYQAEVAGVLAVVGRRLKNDMYSQAATRMVRRFLTHQVEGLWSLDYWYHFPIKEPPPANYPELNQVPDPRYTAAVLWCLGLYHRATADADVVAPARKAMAMMFRRWDFMGQDWLHLTREYVALAVAAWEDVLPEFAARKAPIVQWAVETFVASAPHDFPFFTTMRTLLLLECTGTQYLVSTIRPAIDALLDSTYWRYEHNPHDFRHLHRLSAHVDTRANTAMALTMKLHDVAAGEAVYTATDLYAYLSQWIDSMRHPAGGYYEGKEIGTGQRFGRGSPAHVVPLLWILGGVGS